MQGWPQRHRISVGHFYRMADAGLFDADERVELVDGEIIDMPPHGSRHASAIEQLTRMLMEAFGTRAIVRPQLPLRLGEYSEPQPDIAVARPRADHYAASHPTAGDALLVIEISDSTVRYDREIKAGLYARHSVPELWVIDVNARVVHRYREPVNGTYADESVSPLARIPVATTGVEIDLATLAIAHGD